jgi:hypothetical protein
MDELAELTTQLHAIDSVNPATTPTRRALASRSLW